MTHNGAEGQWYVPSQSRNRRYVVVSQWAACGPKCGCEDFQKGYTCKHIYTASLAEAQSRIERRMAAGESLRSIEDQLLTLACSGIPAEIELGWTAYWTVVQAMQDAR